MRYSILHISDLHRDLKDELGNGPLLESIARDIARYDQQGPPILRPAVCVVSGDLIFGTPPSHPDAVAEIARQYAQALEFLSALTDTAFDGDRERVILIPGNHDISYAEVIGCSTRIGIPDDQRKRKALSDELFSPNSRLRWSWSEMSYFRIEDIERYEKRLDGFARTFDSFYNGKRTFAMAPESQFCIFDYPELCLSIAALNSCYRNDPLQRSGAFHPFALSAACAELRKPARAGFLLAATWHHSVGGGPAQNDFLDHESVQYLIEAGVSLGFHGHQHNHDCIDERNRLGPDQRKITLVSASTLCADPGNLKPGVPRGYNIVEIDTDGWGGRVHGRRMINSNFALPMWGPGQFNISHKSYVDFALSPPPATRPTGLDINLQLEGAETFLREGKWRDAISTLKPLVNVPIARRFLIEALSLASDEEGTIDILWPPATPEEAAVIGAAILSSQRTDRVPAFLQLQQVAGATDASVVEIRRRILMRWPQ